MPELQGTPLTGKVSFAVGPELLLGVITEMIDPSQTLPWGRVVRLPRGGADGQPRCGRLRYGRTCRYWGGESGRTRLAPMRSQSVPPLSTADAMLPALIW